MIGMFARICGYYGTDRMDGTDGTRGTDGTDWYVVLLYANLFIIFLEEGEVFKI